MHFINLVLHGRQRAQLLDVVFRQQGTSKDTYHFVDVAVQVEVVLNDGHEAVGDDGCIDLDADGILTGAPEGFHPEMLLYKFEEKFDQPTFLVQKSYLPGCMIEVVGVVGERSLQFRSIVHDPAYRGGILGAVSLAGEPDGLVSEDIFIIVLFEICPRYNLVLGLTLLSDNKEGLDELYAEKTCEIPISTVKNIACMWLILNIIHSINIMHLGIGNLEEDRNLSNHVDLSVHLDPGLRAAELSPFEQRHAEINGCRVESIVLAIEFELLIDSLVLGQTYHVVSEVLEDVVVPHGISLCQVIPAYRLAAHAQMIRLRTMSRSDISQLTEASASVELSEYQDHQLIPMSQLPLLRFIVILLHESFKISLWKELHDLTEYVFALVHVCQRLNDYASDGSTAKGSSFQIADKVFELKSSLDQHVTRRFIIF